MTDTGEWRRGELCELIAEFDISQFTTDDPAPKVGDIGFIGNVNTMNGVPRSIGVHFDDRNWVIPVELLRVIT